MTNIHIGAVQPRVQKVLDQFVESGLETSLQAAAYWRGELVIDAIASVAEPAIGVSRLTRQ